MANSVPPRTSSEPWWPAPAGVDPASRAIGIYGDEKEADPDHATDQAGSHSHSFSWPLSGGATSASPTGGIGAPGSQQYFHHLMNQVHQSFASLQGQPNSDIKTMAAFQVEFDGLPGQTLAGTMYDEILEETVATIQGIGRTRAGWNEFDVFFLDDAESDTAKGILAAMEDNQIHSGTFSMKIEYLSPGGVITSTTELFGCRFESVNFDLLHSEDEGDNLRRIVTKILPSTVTFS